jgi:hypothetical protein
VTGEHTDRALVAFGIAAVLGIAAARVYLRAESATRSAEQSLAEGLHLTALVHAQEASRAWLPWSPFRGRAEGVLGKVIGLADETHGTALKAIAERAVNSARIESEWLYTRGHRRRVHGRPSWLSVAFVTAGVASLAAMGRLGRRWPVALGVALTCYALGYLLPV